MNAHVRHVIRQTPAVPRRLFTCFVSSTFKDLKDERARLVRVLLGHECVPFGMEFFPSAGQKQWPIIVDAIEAADFCVFVVAGRYGSISDEPPLSWTHREFRKAVELGKPIAAMIHKSPDSIPAGRCDLDPELKTSLAKFRTELENETVCAYYEDEADLVEGVAASIRTFREGGQLTGWIRASEPVAPPSVKASTAQPKMTLSVAGASPPGSTRLVTPILRPWPIDEERVVANALHDARKEAEAARRGLSGNGTISAVLRSAGYLPTQEDREAAWAKFEKRLVEHESKLREWLDLYRLESARRSNGFELVLSVSNELHGAHADNIELTIALSEQVSPLTDDPKAVTEPPKAPRYRPPVHRPGAFGILGDPDDIPRVRGWEHLDFESAHARSQAFPRRSAVRWNADRTFARISVGSLYMGRSETLERVRLQVTEPGTHRIACALYSKSLTEPIESTIELVVPQPAPERPAFGRITGIVQYPDVDLLDDSGKVVHRARTADPPLTPPQADDAGVRGRISGFVALSSWIALGLDPEDDLGASDARVTSADE